MNPKRLAVCLLVFLFAFALVHFSLTARVAAQHEDAKASSRNETPAPKAKDGRKLLSAQDLLRVSTVNGPRISPDSARVAYTVSETRMEKDKEWKGVTHVWVAPTVGRNGLPNGQPRQFTRGDKNANAPEWSPDGKLLAFLTDREKDGERQVWMMPADGGEAWAVTTHKGGVSGFHFTGRKQLLLSAQTSHRRMEDQETQRRPDGHHQTSR